MTATRITAGSASNARVVDLRKRPVRSFLLPAGEARRDGRMRVIGFRMNIVLWREADDPSSAPSGHLLPGGEGDQARSCRPRNG